jgi:hypothetical protein
MAPYSPRKLSETTGSAIFDARGGMGSRPHPRARTPVDGSSRRWAFVESTLTPRRPNRCRPGPRRRPFPRDGGHDGQPASPCKGVDCNALTRHPRRRRSGVRCRPGCAARWEFERACPGRRPNHRFLLCRGPSWTGVTAPLAGEGTPSCSSRQARRDLLSRRFTRRRRCAAPVSCRKPACGGLCTVSRSARRQASVPGSASRSDECSSVGPRGLGQGRRRVSPLPPAQGADRNRHAAGGPALACPRARSWARLRRMRRSARMDLAGS